MSTYNTRNTSNIPQFKVKHNFFWIYFFLSAVIECNKLDVNVRNFEILNIFKKSFLNFIRPSGSSVIREELNVNLLTTLSHLHKHKFKHGFQDSLNPISNCVSDIETEAHFLLHCPHYSNKRSTFLGSWLKNINRNTFDKNDFLTLLYDNSFLDDKINILILNATIDFLFLPWDLRLIVFKLNMAVCIAFRLNL